MILDRSIWERLGAARARPSMNIERRICTPMRLKAARRASLSLELSWTAGCALNEMG